MIAAIPAVVLFAAVALVGARRDCIVLPVGGAAVLGDDADIVLGGFVACAMVGCGCVVRLCCAGVTCVVPSG